MSETNESGPTETERIIRECAQPSRSRYDMWAGFLRSMHVKRMAEIGVFRGKFAERALGGCDSIETYYMVDPWRHLEDWDKPANKDSDRFEELMHEAMERTESFAAKRVVLRGRTTEVVDRIPDGSLDFAYIDGDHTLRGITIDLVRLYPKVRTGGWIGGDDFTRTVWQHATAFEPTLVFPFAVHFAEAVGARLYALPGAQFLLEKSEADSFSFVDLTGDYADVGLQSQFRPGVVLKRKALDVLPFVRKLVERGERRRKRMLKDGDR